MAARQAGAATGSAAMKKSGRKATKLKGRNALTDARRRGSAAADLQKQLDQRTRELAEAQKRLVEALEQQTAAAEVLRIISNSPSDAQPVFDAIAKHVPRLCKAPYCWVFRFDGKLIHFAAEHGLSPAHAPKFIELTFLGSHGSKNRRAKRTSSSSKS
jgi:hypothetical protein